ncbi:MAG: hypothetical protein LBG74_06285 [Spirochaetaceae bacterium]|jgi:hypothetical protein|nr:hypothetical protein [Spirochaetaceae bacterium]
MLQVYFLSVLCPAVCGWFLYSSADDAQAFEPLLNIQGKELPFRLIAGIATAITGVLTLLSPVEGDVPVAGDIVPAVASLAGGLMLMEEHFHLPDDVDFRPRFFDFLQKHRKTVGVGLVIISALHFLLPKALFL